MTIRIPVSDPPAGVDGALQRPMPTLEDDTLSLLRRRLRLALIGCLGPILLFAVADLGLRHHLLLLLYGIKAMALVLLVATWLVLDWATTRRAIVAVALVSAAVMYALSTASAVAGAEPLTTALINIVVMIGAATLLPWGVWPQLVLVVSGLLADVATVRLVSGGFSALVTYPNVFMLIAAGLSLFVADELQRGRVALRERLLAQRRSEAEVRLLNRELEERVRQRSEDFERANRKLAVEASVRSKAEAVLRRFAAEVAALIENSSHAIWSVDRDYRLVVWNSAAIRRLGELLGNPQSTAESLIDGAAPTRQIHLQSLYDRAFAGERFSVETRTSSSGEARSFLTSLNPIYVEGEITSVAVFSSETTEQTRMEEAMRRHQADLAHVLRVNTLGEMAAGLAHEINQPLGAIASYAQGASRRLRLESANPAALREAVEAIAAEALRAGEIIRRLRMLVQREVPRQEPVPINDLIADVARLVEAEAHGRGVEIEIEADASSPSVCVDGIQIEQVVLNLLRNGVDAAAEAPSGRRRVSISTSHSAANEVQVSLRDSGRGLAPGVEGRLFEPFVSTKPKGLGMGLSISRSIIELHGGRLWFTPAPGGGSIFSFTLAIALQADQTATGPVSEQSLAGSPPPR
jgi:two-component system, LuxR family, sensor kinase FixL